MRVSSTRARCSSSLNRRTLIAHTPVSMLGKMLSTSCRPANSAEETSVRSGSARVSGGSGDQQHIVLANVDLRASLGLDAQASDHQLIAELMQRGKLLVDQT